MRLKCRRRLKHITADTIELFHETSLAHLEMILASGAIEPTGVTGYMSSGSAFGEPTPIQDGVYLANKNCSEDYGLNAVDSMSRTHNKFPNIPVRLYVDVDTSLLAPDLDDLLELHSEEDWDDDITYEDSLKEIGQCVYMGSIPANKIYYVSVVSVTKLNWKAQDLFFSDYLDTGIKFPVDEFIEIIARLDEAYAQQKGT